ncbi:uncharacterized protein ATC70_004367 [Mucor velutinosus]|uniref:Uncharacterized protein n=1 Tax=Mucor velutinosus TaxID=708070 RepID=A0AAN7DSP3_9FUNG|nr:hypothetical protein ATC70_004367 [Mucor velutinosus]
MNASGVNVNEARRAVPARHPRPLSSAERNQQEPSSSSANSRPNGGSNVINLDDLTGDVGEEVNTSLSDRYLKWQDLSEVLLKSYIESHELHGHADPCLDAPIIIGTKPQSCDCTSRITSWPINGFMMFKRCIFQVEYCSHQTLLESLLMSQMMPTATVFPKSAVHFSLFESMIDNRLNAYSSVYGFVKANNASNLRLSSYDPKFIKELKNTQLTAYIANMMWKEIAAAWHARSRQIDIVDNGNPNIFLTSEAEKAKFGDKADVDKYDRAETAATEDCLLENLDSEFQALSNNRRTTSNRFDENGVFSINCARHGIVERLFDIFEGEGRKYALAGVEHVIKNLEEDQKLLIMYDVACACRETFNKAFPELQSERDVWYAVSIFHAYAHSAACQAKNNPRYVDHALGLTDGEGAERFWSFANHFVAQIRSMTKANRRAMIVELAEAYCDEKMIELPNLFVKKYDKAMDTIRRLNMTKSAYSSFEVQWNSHRTALAVPFSNVRNLQRLHERAEGNILLMNDIKHEYAVTAGQLIFLNSRDSPITSGYITGLKRQLEAKLNELERLFPQLIVHGGRPTTFGHITMQQYFDAIKDECHNILVKVLRQLIFSIFMNDNELRRPNSTGTDKAARLLVSIASSTKKAGLVVDSINNFVDRNFGGDPSKKVPSVAIELQRLRNNEDADFLRLSQGMKDWHTLRKCVEETSILVEEAQRYEQNLLARIDGIYEAARQNHLIKIDYLKWNPPRYNPEAGDDDLVVVCFADRSDVHVFSPRPLADDRADEEGIVGSDNGRDDEVDDDDEESDGGDDDRGYGDSQTNMADSIASTLASVMLEQST